jgi:hypothetical protein
MSEKRPTVFTNPFAGKCIHGVEGARMELGVLVNPKCEACTPPKGKPPREN